MTNNSQNPQERQALIRAWAVQFFSAARRLENFSAALNETLDQDPAAVDALMLDRLATSAYQAIAELPEQLSSADFQGFMESVHGRSQLATQLRNQIDDGLPRELLIPFLSSLFEDQPREACELRELLDARDYQ